MEGSKDGSEAVAEAARVARIAKLRDELSEAEAQYALFAKVDRLVPSSGILLFFVGIGVYVLAGGLPWFIVGTTYLGISLVFLLFPLTTPLLERADSIRNEISLAQIGSDLAEGRAEKLFQSHEYELKRYYRQTLRQSSMIFFVGLICIVVGFLSVGASFYAIIWRKNSSEMSDKILAASMGTVSGILSNFVGAVYLRMFSRITSSLSVFHRRLVSTNHLHFANFLISKITDETTRNETLSRIACGVSIPTSEITDYQKE